jgi:hypothetical protein
MMGRSRRTIARFALAGIALGAFPACTTVIINNGGGGGGGSSEGHHALIPWRTGLSLGVWSGNLSESYGTQASKTTIAPAWGGLYYAGVGFGPVFVDWSPTYYAVGKVGSSDGTNNAYYLSLTGFEAGFTLRPYLRFLPLEVFVGYDPSGELGFSTGGQSVFDGTALKVGVALPVFATSPYAGLGFRAEARHNSLSLNNTGPVSISVDSWSYFAGIAFMFAE